MSVTGHFSYGETLNPKIFISTFKLPLMCKMADNSSVDACLNSGVTNIVEIKLIKAQLYQGELAWKDNRDSQVYST